MCVQNRRGGVEGCTLALNTMHRVLDVGCLTLCCWLDYMHCVRVYLEEMRLVRLVIHTLHKQPEPVRGRADHVGHIRHHNLRGRMCVLVYRWEANC